MVGASTWAPARPAQAGVKLVTLIQQILSAGTLGAIITAAMAWIMKRQDLKITEQQQRIKSAEEEARHKITTAAEIAKTNLEWQAKVLGHGEHLFEQDMQRIGRLEANVGRLEAQVTHLQKRLEEEETANSQLRVELETMTRQYNDVAGRCEVLIVENDKLRTANETMSKTIKFDANQLAQKVSDLEELVMQQKNGEPK